MRVPIDCIAGTSMGALVGGGYASGMPAAEIEKFIVGIDWKKVVGSQGRRDLEPIEQKRAGSTYSNDFEFGITPNGVKTPGRPDQDEQRRGSAAKSTSRTRGSKRTSTGCRFLIARSRPTWYPADDGRARPWRPRHCDARQHGDSRRVRAGAHGQADPVGRRAGPQHSRSTSRASCARMWSSS